MTTSTAAQALIAAIKADVESDAAVIASPPVITLLTNLSAHKGNRVQQGADVVQFVATAPAAGLQLEAEVEGQFLDLAITWIKAEVSKAPAPAAPASPAVGAQGAA